MRLPSALGRTGTTFHQTFAALDYPNYRLWFGGQLVSLAGTWMQTTAQGYLVYELTKSPAFLGYVGFAAGLPSWVFTLYAGVIADRMSRRTLLIMTQTSMMLLAFVLAGLVFASLVQPWQIVVLALLTGIANAFDAPARQAFVVELVDRKDLTNAIALNSTMFNAATVVGPALAGVVYALVGPAWCFTINALSFLAVILALLLMQLPRVERKPRSTTTTTELREGLRYTAAQPVILTLVLNVGVISLFGISLMTLLPAWSVDVLGGDVRTNALLVSARGVGALAGALMIASLGQRAARGKLWTIGGMLLPLAMALFAAVHVVPLAVATLVIVGWSFMVAVNTSNALVQTMIPDELRGRVMGIYVLVFFGAFPLGSLWVGQLALWLGEPATVMVNAAVLALVAAFIWVRLPHMRRLL